MEVVNRWRASNFERAEVEAVLAHGGEVLDDTRLPNAVFARDCEGQLVELLAGDGFARRLHTRS
jgi:hypothetical protein